MYRVYTMAGLAGVGRLRVTTCALANTGFQYTNESSVTQNYLLTDSYTTRNNTAGDPDTGLVSAGGSFTITDDDSHDLMRFTLSNGSRVIDFVIAQTRDASHECQYWGEIYSG